MNEWRERAACAAPEVEVDFHEDGRRAQRRAAEFCKRSCDVLAECLAYSLQNEDVFGVWGGATQYERRHALNVSVGGRALNEAETRCPACRGDDVAISRIRRKHVPARCRTCGLSWLRRRSETRVS